MSAQPISLETPQPPSWRPRLRLVPNIRPSVSNYGFIGILVCLVALGLGLVMIVTTQVSAQSRELSSLRKEATVLSYQAAALTTELQTVSNTGSLAIRAADLGMVPNPYPAFIRLSDGVIIGEPTPVKGDEAPFLRRLPSDALPPTGALGSQLQGVFGSDFGVSTAQPLPAARQSHAPVPDAAAAAAAAPVGGNN